MYMAQYNLFNPSTSHSWLCPHNCASRDAKDHSGLEHPQVKIHCENEAVVQVVATSKIKDPYLGACIRYLLLIITNFYI